ncbi:MAG: serine acetyltransferase [Bdellovibrionales bacterium]
MPQVALKTRVCETYAMHEKFWALRRLALNPPRFCGRFLRNAYRGMEFLTGSFIPFAAKFDGQPCFPHGIHGIFISGGAKIGRNCVIFQHVTIGSNTIPSSRSCGFPVLGDNCYIGAGAKIIGNVNIGHNVRIGANAVVYKDVPPNSVVLNGPQIVRPIAEPDNRFYSYRGGKWVYFDNGEWKEAENQNQFQKLGQPY